MRERIAEALKAAAGGGDETRLAVLRLVAAAIKDREKQSRPETEESAVNDAAIRELLARMVAQREESAKIYEEAGRLELAERERAEIGVLREFLPRPMSAEEIARAVDEAVAATQAAGIRDVAKVMARLKALYPDRMDFTAAAAATRRALSPGG